MIPRRTLLAALASLGIAPNALGFGKKALVDIAELDLGSGTLTRPNAWKRLLYEVIQTTSVECDARTIRVPPDEPDLFQHPFLVLPGADAFDKVDEKGLEQLQRFLQYGGFLFIDDTTGADNGGFDKAVRRLVGRLFPTRPLSPLPSDHSVYRSFFLLRRPLGRLDRYRFLEGITVGNLSPVIYCRNDLSGALDRSADGRNRNSCVPGGELQRRESIKLGINLIMYSLTANYKRDQAHVVELKRQGRLE